MCGVEASLDSDVPPFSTFENESVKTQDPRDVATKYVNKS